MKYCNICGHQIIDDTIKFCPCCGSEINSKQNSMNNNQATPIQAAKSMASHTNLQFIILPSAIMTILIIFIIVMLYSREYIRELLRHNNLQQAVTLNEDVEEFEENDILENEINNSEVQPLGVEFNGHHYQFSDDSLTRDDAESQCEAQNGHLATITSSEEQEFLLSLIENTQKKNMWIGAYIDEDSSIRWITGEDFSQYNNWAEGEPNNVFNSQNAVMMYTNKSQGVPGTWNDESGNGRDWVGYYLSDFGFICEWDE